MAGQPEQPNRPRGAPAVGLGVLLAVVCCAGPLLLSAGLLASVGGLLRIRVLLVAAALAVAAAIGLLLRRQARADPARCPPPSPAATTRPDAATPRGGPTGPA